MDDKKDDKVIPINDEVEIKEINVDALRDSVEYMKENMDFIKEYFHVDAELRYSKFQSLVEQGFTEKEALELVKSLW